MSIETATGRVIAEMVSESKKRNIPVCEILASVVKECLLSNDNQPHHCYGIEFVQKCDKCLGG